MLSLIAGHFKTTWLVYIAFILAIGSVYAYKSVQVNTLERELNKQAGQLAQCESARLIQNDAVLKWQQAGEAAKQRQIDVDKVTAMFRTNEYKSIDSVKTMKWPAGCDDAAALGIELMTKKA